MQDAGRHDVLRVAGGTQECADLERMKHERSVVSLANLPRVSFHGELERGAGERRPLDKRGPNSAEL